MNNDIQGNNLITMVDRVYRVDFRSPNQIRNSGGFFPWDPGPKGQTLHDLAYHFSGTKENSDDVSAFVSTASKLTTVIDHAKVLFENKDVENKNLDYTAYIYEIRPDTFFYNLYESLDNGMKIAQKRGNYARAESIAKLMFFAGDEYISHGGFKIDRVIRSIKITRSMLKTNVDIKNIIDINFSKEFWAPNESYDKKFNKDRTSSIAYFYEMIAHPRGIIRRLYNEKTESFSPDSYRSFVRANILYPSFRDLGKNRSKRSSRELESESTIKIPENLNIMLKFSDSEYYIRSSIDHSAVVDLSKKESGANVYIYEDLKLSNQKWKISYSYGKRAYKILSSQNKALALTWDSKKDNVIARVFLNNVNQFWLIEEVEDGFYTIKNYNDPSKALNLENSSTNNTNNIQCYPSDDTKAQKWKITSRELAVLPDGEYLIKSRINQNVVVDLTENRTGANVFASENQFHSNQKWKLYYDSGKRAYKIVSSQNESLALTWNSKLNNNVMGFDFQNYGDQFWLIEEMGNGFYVLRNLYDSSKVLDLENSSTGNKTKITVSSENNIKAQKWSIDRVDKPTFLDGIYTISSGLNYKKVIDYNYLHNPNLKIYDNLNLITTEFRLVYNYEKQAYKIYSTEYKDKGIIHELNRVFVKIDNISESEESHWFIEYNHNGGGYIIRNVAEPKMVLNLAGSGLENNSSIVANRIDISSNGDIRKDQIWNFIPKKN